MTNFDLEILAMKRAKYIFSNPSLEERKNIIMDIKISNELIKTFAHYKRSIELHRAKLVKLLENHSNLGY